MYGYNAEQPIAIPIYTVLPYCVICVCGTKHDSRSWYRYVEDCTHVYTWGCKQLLTSLNDSYDEGGKKDVGKGEGKEKRKRDRT